MAKWARFVGIVLMLGIGSAVHAQFSVDTPQTTLSPINGITGSVAPGYTAPGGFNAPGVVGGWQGYPQANTFPNSAPRVRFGTGAGSLLDPYSTSAGNVYPTAPGGALNGFPTVGNGSFAPFGGTFSNGAAGNGSFGTGSFGTGSIGGFFGGGSAGGTIAQQSPPIFGTGGIFGSPSVVPSQTYGAPTGFGGTIYPPTAIPNGSPSTLFPGGLFGNGSFGGGGGSFGAGGGGFFGGLFSGGASQTAFRLLQGPRFRHTFINAGEGQRDLEINDTDVSIAFAFPNFLGSQRPLFVVPSFSLHLWDGPRGATGSDLPSRAYSAFLDFGWQSDPNQMFGLELGVRVGAFTDFDTFNSDTIRVLGKGLAAFRLTPFTTLKGGVYYLNRNRIKLLPAGGLLWQPNPFTRFDIFFPQPKIARYWRTVGTRDVWWYLTGDYGGDSWTISRDNGQEDSIDINDIRVMVGFEWGLTHLIRAGRRTGFVEAGYVFDREVLYRNAPQDDFTTDDAYMVRIGIGY